jgi:putative DNA primase/helicase
MRPAERFIAAVDERANGRSATGQILAGFNLTDLGNAERFVSDHGADVRYCHPWRSWLVWTGARWEPDESGQVHRLAKETVRGLLVDAAEAESDSRTKELARHAIASAAETRIRAMLELAKSEVPVLPDELDADPWVLNCENGTIDLVGSGELLPHRREDLITKLVPVEYDPGAKAPTWEALLERVLPNAEIRAFFKRLCGYALTGDTGEHVLPLLYGTGANGKSTVLNALLDALGDYAGQAAPDLLLAKQNSHPTELADLFGKRLVAAIEVEDGRRLAESLVKQLTGGDRVKARKMRQDFWEFSPTHKVFMAVNHKPTVRGTDTAIWRRIRLIPFTETIPPAEQDKRLPEKLRRERAGILAWAVEGCLEWQREGLQAPDEVRKATREYRAEMDVIAAFIDEECIVAEHAAATAKALYSAYKAWCEENGEKPETQRRFGGRLRERGFESGRITTGARKGAIEWYGIGLAGGPEGSPDGEGTRERFTDKNPSKSPTNSSPHPGSGERSEPKSGINGPKQKPREDKPEKGSLHSLGSPSIGASDYGQPVEERMAELQDDCIHGFAGGRGCYVCDSEHPLRRGSA